MKLLTILSLLVFVACTTVNLQKSDIQKQFDVFDSTILRVTTKRVDIPKYPNGDYYFLWILTKEQERQLRLDSIENSKADEIIRIWKYDQKYLRQPNYLFQIERHQDSVSVVYYSLDDYFSPKTYEIKVINRTRVEYTRFSPNDVLKAFKESGLDLILTDEQLPGYPEYKIHEQKTKLFAIEYSTPTTYRFVQYSDPRENKLLFKESSALFEFLDKYVLY